MMNTKYFALTEKGIVSGDADDVRRKVSGLDVRALHKMKGGLPVSVNAWDFTHKTEKENRDSCKRISDELDAYAEGRVCRCPECGELHDLSDAGDAYKCPDCGEVSPVEAWETCGMWDYFDAGTVLDIDYIVNYRKEYKACRVLVAYGGPNIYIDTYSGAVEMYWWTDRADFPLSRSTMAQIDEWAEEYFNCL